MGDWLLIENVHLEKDWLPNLAEIIQKINPAKVNNRFRLFMSMQQIDYCPETIVKNCVKVALQ